MPTGRIVLAFVFVIAGLMAVDSLLRAPAAPTASAETEPPPSALSCSRQLGYSPFDCRYYELIDMLLDGLEDQEPAPPQPPLFSGCWQTPIPPEVALELAKETPEMVERVLSHLTVCN